MIQTVQRRYAMTCLLAALLGVVITTTYTKCNSCSTLYLPRPQGSNTAYFYNPYNYGCGSFPSNTCSIYTIGFRFNQTFDGKNIAKSLLGNNKLTFVGFGDSDQATDQTVASDSQFVRADDFGLSPFYKGTIVFHPRMRNYNLDFIGRWELGERCNCLKNFYASVNATLTHTNWDWMHQCSKAAMSNLLLNPELVTLAVDNMFPLGELTEYRNFDGFKSIPEALQAERGFGGQGFSTYGILGPMRYGRFVLDRPAQTTALANIDAILGYDFFRHDNSHFGLFIRTSAPTGTQIKSLTIFEPVIGNGHHWELGGGIDAHWKLWNGSYSCVIGYLIGNVTHLFKDRQTRIIPLVSGCCLSQYSLLKEYAQSNLLIPTLVRGTDVAARHAQSSFAVQGDATLGCIYHHCNWAFGAGFNIFGRSHETLTNVTPTCDLNKRAFGIKGRTPAFAPLPAPQAPGLYIPATTSTYCITNPNNANTPIDGTPIPVPNSTDWYTGSTAYTANPTYLDLRAIHTMHGVPCLITYKVFGTIDHKWENCKRKPFLGIGGEAEFDNHQTANQWGIWMRGGIMF
jgi:hypothetical protein